MRARSNELPLGPLADGRLSDSSARSGLPGEPLSWLAALECCSASTALRSPEPLAGGTGVPVPGAAAVTAVVGAPESWHAPARLRARSRLRPRRSSVMTRARRR